MILYPGLCTRLFASLKQVTVVGLKSSSHSGNVLAVDYSIEAFGSEHQPYVILVAGGMISILPYSLDSMYILKPNTKSKS